jgi:hypothetical protein
MKCVDCKFVDSAYLKGYDGTGTYSTRVCKEDITIGKIVDGDIERECAKFQPIKQLEAANAKG